MKDFVSRFRHGLIAAYCPSLPGGGSGNLLPDQSNSRNNITLTSFSQSDWTSSQQGRTLYFDGVDNYGATQRQIFSGRSIVSVMTWAQTISGTQIEINEGDSNTFRAGCGLSGDGNSYIVNSQGGGVLSNFCFASWSAFQGQAVCIVSVLDVTQVLNTDRAKIYIQGLSRSLSYSGSGPLTSSPIGTFTGPTQIGRRPTNDNYSTGNLYCIAVWDRVITAEEAMQLYVLGPRGSSEAVSLKGNLRSTFAKRYAYKPAKPRNYGVVRVKETDYGNLRQGLVGAWCPSLPNGGSGNTLPDQSGFNNHGSLVNMSPDDWVSGQYGRALDFDGSNDSVKSGAVLPNLTPAFTLSLWVYIKSLPSSGSITNILSTYYTTGSQLFGFDLRFRNDAGVHKLGLRGGDGTNTTELGSDEVYELPTLRWINLLFTVTSSGAIGYQDSIQITTYSTMRGVPMNANKTLSVGSLGAYSSPGQELGRFFNGVMDDIRVYNRALTESEIRLLASRPGIGLRQDRDRNTFYQFPSFQPALARRSSAIIGGGIT